MTSRPSYTIEVYATGLGWRATVEGHGESQMTGEAETVEGVTLNDLLSDIAEACKLDETARREFRLAEAGHQRAVDARNEQIKLIGQSR